MSLTLKIILLESALLFSTTAEAKKHCFVHLSFNSLLQLINGISSDCQKLIRYFNGTAIAKFFQVQLFPFAAGFSNNLAFSLKDLKVLVFIIAASKLGSPS